MNTKISSPNALSRLFLILASAAALAPAYAQERLVGTQQVGGTPPESSITLGASVTSGDEKDRARFGMFNGLREHDVNGLFGFGYYRRDDASGRWFGIEGRNLGLDNREVGVSYRWLGDMRLNVDYSEITRHEPRTINTSMQGIGTTTPVVTLLATPGTGSDVNLELKRKGLGFDFAKQFGNFQLEVAFKNEDKTGARIWGRGFACSQGYVDNGNCSTTTQTALFMLPEPVDSTIRQFDLKLNYTGDKLRLSGGYYGNYYTNNVGSLNPTYLGANYGNFNGGTLAWTAPFRNYMQTPMALWPDSQSHQFYLGGNYALTSHTRLNFKYSYTYGTQNESFSGMGLATTPFGSDLGAKISTQRGMLGFSSHPMAKLHLHGDIAFMNKNNYTPLAYYNQSVATGPVFTNWTNNNASPKSFDAKLEGNYHLPYELQLIGGIKYQLEDAGKTPNTDLPGGVAAIREKFMISSYRVELRKAISETFTGSIALFEERKVGTGPWLKVSQTLAGRNVINSLIDGNPDCAAATAANCLWAPAGGIPYQMENLQREKIRLNGTWTPLERFSLQAYYEKGKDDFRGPTSTMIPGGTNMYNFTLDAAYQISDDWKVNAYVTDASNAARHSHSTSDYIADIKDKSLTFGLGFSGKPAARFRVGGDALYMRDSVKYALTPLVAFPGVPGISAANYAILRTNGGIPDVDYNLLRISLYGAYEIDKSSSVRLNYVYNRSFFNEWAYNNNGTPFLYSDNTTLSAKQLQSVNYVGASYTYKFQ